MPAQLLRLHRRVQTRGRKQGKLSPSGPKQRHSYHINM